MFVKDFKELPTIVDLVGLKPLIPSGTLYWVKNKDLENETFRFANHGEKDFHPVLVMYANEWYADARLLTTEISRNQGNGILLDPDLQIGLKKPSVVLTKREYHLLVPVAAFQQRNYLCNVGPCILSQIRVAEQV